MVNNLRWMISGAGGYIGATITEYLQNQNHFVYQLMHVGNKPPSPHSEFTIPYSLEAGVDRFIFNKIDVFVHCAWDFTLNKWMDINRVNINGSAKIINAAISQGVKKVIFISTISSFKNCKSNYGRAKLEVEKIALDAGAIVIRPGLVYGENSGGMIGSLNKVVSTTRFVPLIGNGNQKLYLLNDQDLCNLIFKFGIGEFSNYRIPILAANSNSKTFRNILNILGQNIGKKLIFIPIPWVLIWLILSILEKIGFNLRFRSDSLISLIYTNPNPLFILSNKFGFVFKEYEPIT